MKTEVLLTVNDERVKLYFEMLRQLEDLHYRLERFENDNVNMLGQVSGFFNMPSEELWVANNLDTCKDDMSRIAKTLWNYFAIRLCESLIEPPCYPKNK